jgi:hypothetical protein
MFPGEPKMNLGHMTDDHYDPIAPKLDAHEQQIEDCQAWGEELDLLGGKYIAVEVEPDANDYARCEITMVMQHVGAKNPRVTDAVRAAGLVMSGKPTEEQRLTELRDAMRALLRTVTTSESIAELKRACSDAEHAILKSL